MQGSPRKNTQPQTIEDVECLMLYMRLQAAQALRKGQQPATGALNYTLSIEDTEEAHSVYLN